MSRDSEVRDSVQRVQQLFLEHAAEIRGFTSALMPDEELVDDVVQETFMAISARADDYDPGRSFRGWAFGFARRKVLEVGRRARRGAEPLPADILELLAATENEMSLLKVRLRFLDECVGRLAPTARKVIEQCYQQALKPSEIGRRMGWTAASVSVALSRARAAIRKCLDQKISAIGESI